MVGVFGGHQDQRQYKRVSVKLQTKDRKELELDILETDVICDQILPSPPKMWTDRLTALGYDVANFSVLECIELLIGSDHF